MRPFLVPPTLALVVVLVVVLSLASVGGLLGARAVPPPPEPRTGLASAEGPGVPGTDVAAAPPPLAASGRRAPARAQKTVTTDADGGTASASASASDCNGTGVERPAAAPPWLAEGAGREAATSDVVIVVARDGSSVPDATTRTYDLAPWIAACALDRLARLSIQILLAIASDPERGRTAAVREALARLRSEDEVPGRLAFEPLDGVATDGTFRATGTDTALDAWERRLDATFAVGGCSASVEVVVLDDGAAVREALGLPVPRPVVDGVPRPPGDDGALGARTEPGPRPTPDVAGTPPVALAFAALATGTLATGTLATATRAAARATTRVRLDVPEDRHVFGFVGDVAAYVADYDIEISMAHCLPIVAASDAGLGVAARWVRDATDGTPTLALDVRHLARRASPPTFPTFTTGLGSPSSWAPRITIERDRLDAPADAPGTFRGRVPCAPGGAALVALTDGTTVFVRAGDDVRSTPRRPAWRRVVERASHDADRSRATQDVLEIVVQPWGDPDGDVAHRFEVVPDAPLSPASPFDPDAFGDALVQPVRVTVVVGPDADVRRFDLALAFARPIEPAPRTLPARLRRHGSTTLEPVMLRLPWVTRTVVPVRVHLARDGSDTFDATADLGRGPERWTITVTRRVRPAR